jgi:hypothetical protein
LALLSDAVEVPTHKIGVQLLRLNSVEATLVVTVMKDALLIAGELAFHLHQRMELRKAVQTERTSHKPVALYRTHRRKWVTTLTVTADSLI